MKIYCLMIVMAAFLSAGCSSTFLVSKDGKGYFLGSNSNAKYELLCASGDLEKVLASSHLDQEMKKDLYKYNCSAERSGEKVKQIYASMTPDQRKEIRSAFRNNGYEINHMLC